MASVGSPALADLPTQSNVKTATIDKNNRVFNFIRKLLLIGFFESTLNLALINEIYGLNVLYESNFLFPRPVHSPRHPPLILLLILHNLLSSPETFIPGVPEPRAHSSY